VEDNATIPEKIRHGRIDGLVGSGDLEADFPEHGRHGPHPGSGNPKKVEVFKVGSIQHGTPLRMEDEGSGVEQNLKSQRQLWGDMDPGLYPVLVKKACCKVSRWDGSHNHF